MFKNLRIGPRLLLLLAVQTVLLIVVGVIALFALRYSTQVTEDLRGQLAEGGDLAQLRYVINDEVVRPINEVNNGIITWSDAEASLEGAAPRFDRLLNKFVQGHATGGLNIFSDTLGLHIASVREGIAEALRLVKLQDRGQVELFVVNELNERISPFLNATQATSVQEQMLADATVAEALAAENEFLTAVAVAIAVGVLLAILLGAAVYRSITGSVRAIESTVHEVNEGDLSARVTVDGSDELKELGDSFNRLLDERVAQLMTAQRENETLNDSVIGLLQGVAKLADKDLRIRVPVTEDITGPVADALNLMSSETANVLGEVRSTAAQVAHASQEVKSKADSAMALSRDERTQIRQSSRELSKASEQMLEVAALANQCNDAAARAIETTDAAQVTVQGTVTGITSIRDIIRETEKRIKRLGERSQEISGAVNLINTIAERTHILALNASMHAASAGEAGRGFAVVADEVQRLAENAREATREISGLVDNIQVETADTVTTMNEVITQVVKGTEMAESAGSRMLATREQTDELVGLVGRISERAAEQAEISKGLVRRSLMVAKSTEETHRQLTDQSSSTELLAGYSDHLVKSVAVFQLPSANDTVSGTADPAAATVVDFPVDDMPATAAKA